MPIKSTKDIWVTKHTAATNQLNIAKELQAKAMSTLEDAEHNDEISLFTKAKVLSITLDSLQKAYDLEKSALETLAELKINEPSKIYAKHI